MPQKEAKKFLTRYGIFPEDPLIVQVSRFDIWKNPVGLIDAFGTAQAAFPEAKLMLVGFKEAKDNPLADAVFKEVEMAAKRSPGVFLFFEPAGFNITEFTNIAQNAADIVVQNSIKEGFGLTVTEAMWKSKAVVGGPASGIKRQIKHGKNGMIAKDTEELAKKLVYLLKNPKKRLSLGKEANKTVREHFLMPRLVLDHLNTYKEVVEATKKETVKVAVHA